MFLPAFELLFLKPTIASIAQRGEERRRRPRLGRSRTDDGYRSFRRLLLDTLIADWISLRGGFDKNRPDSRDLYLASFALTSFEEKRRGNDGLNREGVRELGLKRRLRRLNVETVGWTGKSEIILIYICIFNRLKYIYIYIILLILLFVTDISKAHIAFQTKPIYIIRQFALKLRSNQENFIKHGP